MTHGLDLQREYEAHTEKDWVFGSASKKCTVFIAENERYNYLPLGEVQRGVEDTMDCATRAPLNVLETKLNFLYNNDLFDVETLKWLIKNKYITRYGIELSDAFNAIKSRTSRTGNSLKEPIHSIHKDGVIPKSMLPLEKSMTWEQYHDPKRITAKMEKLGQEFLKRISINYERVYANDWEELLKDDMLIVAGHAWSKPVNGIYLRTDKRINHAFMNVKNKYFIFDNYIDSFDGDFIKHLAEDYKFLPYGYRLFLKLNEVEKEVLWYLDIWNRIKSFICDILKL